MRHLVLAIALLLTSSAALAQEQPGVDVEAIKRSAEREARSKSKEGCKELLDETEAACIDSATRGLNVDCKGKVTALKMSAKQARGEIFDIEAEAGAGKNLQAANTACRVHLRSLRREREKNEAEMLATADTSPECGRTHEILEQCFARLRAGQEMSAACSQVVTIISMRRYSPSMRNQPAANVCKSAVAIFDRSSGRKNQGRKN